MQIEKLSSMPAQLPPPTLTTIFDDAKASPKIWSVKSLIKAKWRSKGALILYAALGLSLFGCKMFWSSGPHKANAAAAAATNENSETRQLMAKLEAASKARTAAAAKANEAKQTPTRTATATATATSTA